jgi:hypothetical protein
MLNMKNANGVLLPRVLPHGVPGLVPNCVTDCSTAPSAIISMAPPWDLIEKALLQEYSRSTTNNFFPEEGKMIQKGENAEQNRRSGISLTIEILKTQPELLIHALDGKVIAKVVTEMSDSLIAYVLEGKSSTSQ